MIFILYLSIHTDDMHKIDIPQMKIQKIDEKYEKSRKSHIKILLDIYHTSNIFFNFFDVLDDFNYWTNI